jgi:hypothetical protein
MGGKSNYLDNKILNLIFNGAAFSPPATLYCALFTTAPTAAGGGAEVSGGSYARVAVAANTTNFPTTTNQSINNATAIVFPTATANWGTIVAAAFFDAASGGNMLYWGPLSVAQTVTSGSQFQLPANTGFTGTES